MEQESAELISQLYQIRTLFNDTIPDDKRTINRYAWIIAKGLHQNYEQIGSLECRKFLADYLKLPTERPSQLHSAILSAAVKVANAYPEFRFAAFLKLWGVQNFRPEDHERQQVLVSGSFAAGSSPVSSSSAAGKSFPSLAEKTARALAHSLLLHHEDELTADLVPLLQSGGYLVRSSSLSLIHHMLITRIKEATGKDGRKYRFATLTSPEGLEVECISSQLQPSPLHPLPEGKRHYVNIGQLYDCLLKTKATVPRTSASVQTTVPAGSPSGITLAEAYLSQQKPIEVFPAEVGYIESIDQQHGHMHIYDAHSRHFVAPIHRFSKEKAGDFIRFIPITPQESKFKTAIILATVPHTVGEPAESTSEVQNTLREIRIIIINKEKGYATWELNDKEHPITEFLSPLQLSQGETSPTFTTGYLNLATVPDSFPSGIIEGQELTAFIYLKRGKDRLKRPHVARLF